MKSVAIPYVKVKKPPTSPPDPLSVNGEGEFKGVRFGFPFSRE
jgi:hypothetical protein